MLAAEAYGFDTAPMEGFIPDAVKREFAIPDEAEVVALLAIGRGADPDKAYPGDSRSTVLCLESVTACHGNRVSVTGFYRRWFLA
jgi:nitroreductase